MKRMQLLFPDSMVNRLKEAALEEERPVSEVVRRCIETYFQHYPRKPRRKLQVAQLADDLGDIQISAKEMREALYDDQAS
jgi:hypothetical protein